MKLSEIEGISFNRIAEHLCVFCGEPLLDESEMGMHAECREKIKKLGFKKNKNRRTFKVKVNPQLVNKKL